MPTERAGPNTAERRPIANCPKCVTPFFQKAPPGGDRSAAAVPVQLSAWFGLKSWTPATAERGLSVSWRARRNRRPITPQTGR